jgi:hypothetical protein
MVVVEVDMVQTQQIPVLVEEVVERQVQVLLVVLLRLPAVILPGQVQLC